MTSAVEVFDVNGNSTGQVFGDLTVLSSGVNAVTLQVKGAGGQAAALQEWRDGAGALVAQLFAAIPAPNDPGFLIKQRVLIDGGLSTPTMFSVKGANPFLRMYADAGSPTGDTEGRIGIDDSNSMSFYAGTQAVQHGIIRFVGSVAASDLAFHAVSDPTTKNHMLHFSSNVYVYRPAGATDSLHFGSGGFEPLVLNTVGGLTAALGGAGLSTARADFGVTPVLPVPYRVNVRGGVDIGGGNYDGVLSLDGYDGAGHGPQNTTLALVMRTALFAGGPHGAQMKFVDPDGVNKGACVVGGDGTMSWTAGAALQIIAGTTVLISGVNGNVTYQTGSSSHIWQIWDGAAYTEFMRFSRPVDATSVMLAVGGVPPPDATMALVRMTAALSGASANGTFLGANPAAFTGDFVNFQIGGVTKFKVDKDGVVTPAPTTILSYM